MTVATYAPSPALWPRLRFIAAAALPFCLLLNFLSLYVPFVLFESANGTCHYTPCAATRSGAWWGFFSQGDGLNVGAREFAASGVLLTAPLMLVVVPLTAASVIWAFNTGRRSERWLSVVALIALTAMVALFATPAAGRLFEVIVD
jgi:hypothetical protein